MTDAYDDLLGGPGLPPPFLSQRRKSFLERVPVLANDELIAKRRNCYGSNCALVMKSDPIVIVRGQGCSLFNEEGREFLDTCNNVASVGHCHPGVVEAVSLQLQQVNTNFRYLHPIQAELAETLLPTFPDPSLSSGSIYLTNSGSEANDLAVRIARAHFYSRQRASATTTIPEEKEEGTGPLNGDPQPPQEPARSSNPNLPLGASSRPQRGPKRAEFHVAVLGGAYHGHLVSTIDLSPYKFMGPGGSGRPPSFVHVLPLPDAPASSGRQAALQAVEEARKRGGKIGLFLAESLPSCAGQVVLPPGWLQDVYSVFKAEGALCVSDEVQAGLGRLGSVFWGYSVHGVVPDMVAIGKGLGNGFPVAALVCTKEAASAFASSPMEYFNTFGGCTAAVAAATATLKVVLQDQLQENAKVVGDYLLLELQGLQRKFSEIVYHVRGMGLMVGVEIALPDGTPAPQTARSIQLRIRRRGVLISVDGPEANVIKIKPPLTFGTEEVDLLVLQLGAVLQEMKLEGQFGEAPMDLFLAGAGQVGVHGRDSSHVLSTPYGGTEVASGYQSRHSELSVCPEDGPMDEEVFGRTPHEIKALELKLLRELSDSATSQSARVASPITPKYYYTGTEAPPGAFSGGSFRGLGLGADKGFPDADTESLASMSSQRSGELRIGGGGGGGAPSVSSVSARDGSRRTSVLGEKGALLPPLEEEEQDPDGLMDHLGSPKGAVEDWLEGVAGRLAGQNSVLGRMAAQLGLGEASGLAGLTVGVGCGALLGVGISRIMMGGGK